MAEIVVPAQAGIHAEQLVHRIDVQCEPNGTALNVSADGDPG
jgi:hypothetical protein